MKFEKLCEDLLAEAKKPKFWEKSNKDKDKESKKSKKDEEEPKKKDSKKSSKKPPFWLKFKKKK